jgi:hypothetical protein
MNAIGFWAIAESLIMCHGMPSKRKKKVVESSMSKTNRDILCAVEMEGIDCKAKIDRLYTESGKMAVPQRGASTHSSTVRALEHVSTMISTRGRSRFNSQLTGVLGHSPARILR